MRIVFATDNYWPRVSGMAVSVDSFAAELTARGHEVHVFAPDYPGAAPRAGGPRVHRFPSMGLFFSSEDRLMRPGAQASVHRLLDELKPDVVHVQTELLVGRAAWRWGRANGVPVVMTAHTHWAQYICHYLPFPPAFGRALVRVLSRRIFANADQLVVPSEAMRRVLEDYGIGGPVAVIPTGIEPGVFGGGGEAGQDPLLLERYPRLRDRRVLLSVGRVAHEKNLPLVLDAFELLLRRYPDLVWLVVGDGPALKSLSADVTRRGLTDHVVTTGYLPRSQLKYAFALAEVFCLASATETQGLATVESLASGVPVVAVDAMGTREVLANEQGGLLSPNDPASFASRVERLLTDQALYRSKVQETRLAAARFSPGVLAERVLQLYGHVLESVRHAPSRLPATTAKTEPLRVNP